jgi:hypothetical protein
MFWQIIVCKGIAGCRIRRYGTALASITTRRGVDVAASGKIDPELHKMYLTGGVRTIVGGNVIRVFGGNDGRTKKDTRCTKKRPVQ